MKNTIYKITDQFEKALCEYTSSPYAVAVDSCTNAIFLSLFYQNIKNKEITIPNRTYPSVPCQIIHAGGKVKFEILDKNTLKGPYQLKGSKTWDSALRFTHDMYIPNTFMCLSFSGPNKHLKLTKGGAILTDNYDSYIWFKRARYNGRRECSYLEDNFDMLGWNFYMIPEISTRGLFLMSQFYDNNGNPLKNEDLEINYPDLSKFNIYI